jgi:hypothetical protein
MRIINVHRGVNILRDQAFRGREEDIAARATRIEKHRFPRGDTGRDQTNTTTRARVGRAHATPDTRGLVLIHIGIAVYVLGH